MFLNERTALPAAFSRPAARPARPAQRPAGGATPGSALREGGGGGGAGAERSSFRDLTEAFPFLHPDCIRDAAQRRPDHPE